MMYLTTAGTFLIRLVFRTCCINIHMLLLLPARSSHRCCFVCVCVLYADIRNSCAYPAHSRLWKWVNARKHIHFMYACMGRSHVPHHTKPPPPPPPKKRESSTWHRHAVDVAAYRHRHSATVIIAWTEQSTPHSIHPCTCVESESRRARETAKMCECVLLWLLTIIQPKQAKTYPTNVCMYAYTYGKKRSDENSDGIHIREPENKCGCDMGTHSFALALCHSVPLFLLFFALHFHHFPHSFDMFICLRTSASECVWECVSDHMQKQTHNTYVWSTSEQQ